MINFSPKLVTVFKKFLISSKCIFSHPEFFINTFSHDVDLIILTIFSEKLSSTIPIFFDKFTQSTSLITNSSQSTAKNFRSAGLGLHPQKENFFFNSFSISQVYLRTFTLDIKTFLIFE